MKEKEEVQKKPEDTHTEQEKFDAQFIEWRGDSDGIVGVD